MDAEMQIRMKGRIPFLLVFLTLASFAFVGCAKRQEALAPLKHPIFVEKPKPAPSRPEPTAPESRPEAPASKEPAAHPTVTDMETSIEASATKVTILTTEPLQYTAFVLSDPTRLVLDMPNVEFSKIPWPERVEKGVVKDVNILKMLDRDIARVEMVLERLGTYDITRIENGIEVRIYAERRPIQPVEAEEARPVAAYHRINAIWFEKRDDGSRIVIQLDGNEPRFDVTRLRDPMRLSIDLVNTLVPGELQKVQSISDPSVPVLSISSFQFKQEPNPRAKIIAQLSRFTPYLVYQEGNRIIVDIASEAAGPGGAVEPAPPRVRAKAAPEEAGPGAPSREALEGAQPPGAPPTEAPPGEMPGGYAGQRVSLDFQDADISDVVRLLAEISGYNIVTSPRVEGAVSIKMVDVPWDQALDVILRTTNYAQYREGNVIIIDTPDMVRRLEQERGAQAPPAAEGAPVGQAPPAVVEGGGAAPGVPVETAGAPALPMVTRYFNLNYISTQRTGTGGLSATSGGAGELATGASTITTADSFDIWGVLQTEINKLMSSENRDERLDINSISGVIRVTDYPENVEKVAEFLDILHENLLKQVIIEAKILEVTLSDDYQLGVNWDYVAKFVGGNGLRGALSGGALIRQERAPAPDPGTFITFGLENVDFSLVVDALSRQGEVRSISNPRISTLNNQKAVIKAGTQEVYFEPAVDVIGATGQTVTTLTPRFLTVGLVLDVVPRIGSDEYITMDVHPSVTAVVGVARAGGTATVPEVSVPELSVRETDTVIRVKDGQTAVIAGFISESIFESFTKTPVLGNLPILSYLFKRTVKQKDRTEIVIFLTPTMVREERLARFTERELSLIQETGRILSGR